MTVGLGVRVGAGVFSAASLLANQAPGPALLVLALSVGPLAFLVGRGAPAARRSLDGLITLGALAAGFAPTLHRLLADVPPLLNPSMLPSAIAWSVLAALIVLSAASGLFAPLEPEPDAG